MKKIVVFLLVSFAIPALSFGQLKKDADQPDFSSIVAQPTNNFLLDFIDPGKIRMNHSFSASFGMGGGQQMLQNAYMNSMYIQLSENVMLSTNLGIMSTPYHTFGESSFLDQPQFFGSAQLDYKISENAGLSLRFEKAPYTTNSMFYNGFDRRYYSPFFSRFEQ